MGILLTFMFLGNMIGALVLIPSLSHFLLRSVSFKPKHAQADKVVALAERSKRACWRTRTSRLGSRTGAFFCWISVGLLRHMNEEPYFAATGNAVFAPDGGPPTVRSSL